MTPYLKRVVPAAALLVLAAAAPAAAEVQPGNIPADSIQTAYPIQPNVTYQGAFKRDIATYHDLDYLAFTVATAGETLEFTLQNTTQGVNPDPFEWCPVYASILNQSNTLVADGAGTVATYGDTESFDWTFSSAGTYYLVMESNGDMPPGDPTYALHYTIATTPSGSPPSPPPVPLVRSLRVPRKQHGYTVSARLTLGQQASLVRAVVTSHRKTIASVTRAKLGTGPHRLTLRLPATYRSIVKQHRKLSLTITLTVAGNSTTVSFVRHVTLTG